MVNLLSKFSLPSLTLLLEEAGREVLRIRQDWSGLEVKKKEGYWDVVSAADKAVESLVVNYLRQQFPDHGINAEEGSLVSPKSDSTWIIDPIDGTSNFISGLDLFSISLGLVRGNSPYFGIIHFPVLGKTIYAHEGQGVYLNDKLLAQRPLVKDLSDCIVVGEICFGHERIYSSIRPFCRNMLITGSFTGAVLWLVESKIAGLFHTGASRYDIAAAIIIAKEAGNIVSGMYKDELDLTARKIPIIMARSDNVYRGLIKIFAENRYE